MKLSIEFRKHLRLGLTAAIGFIIAAAWQDTIMIFMNSLVERTTSITSQIKIYSISALMITIIGVLLLWGLSKVLK